jgi:predicted phosphoribosyltransferase
VRLRDRTTAANILGDALKNIVKKEEERKNLIVLGIPRGGVIADTIAKKLSCELGILTARKLRAPQNEEVQSWKISPLTLTKWLLKNWGYLQNILKRKKHCNWKR